MTPGNIGDLYVADLVDAVSQRGDQVPLCQLHVIEVPVDLHSRRIDRTANCERIRRAIQEMPLVIDWIEWFENRRTSGRFEQRCDTRERPLDIRNTRRLVDTIYHLMADDREHGCVEFLGHIDNRLHTPSEFRVIPGIGE